MHEAMLFVPFDSILVDTNRQRKTFDEKTILSLGESIKRHGLIHALLVEPLPDGTYKLTAGERRQRAIGKLLEKQPEFSLMPGSPPGLVPVTTREGLSDDERFALELEENIQREDLPWQEKAVALAKYHKFQTVQRVEPQTLAKTASEQRVSPGTVTAAIIVADHLHIAEVAKAKTLDDATKIVRRIKEADHRKELAKTFDLTKSEHTFLQEDCLHGLQAYEAGIFDIVCTDPPYGIGADSFGEQSGTGHGYNDDPEMVQKLLTDFAEESYRVTKPAAFAYLFCGTFEWFAFIKDVFGLAGWKVWDRPLVWDKRGNGMLPVPDKGPRYTYELILYAYKGERKVVQAGMPDVLSYPPVKKLLHGAQKPAPLLVDLLQRIALPGDKVLDGFAGSGSIFSACNTLRLVATAFENDEASYNIALQRMNERAESEPVDRAPDLRL